MNLYMDSDAAKAGIRVPIDDVMRAMGETGFAQMGNILPVLHREGLIGGRYDFGGENDESAPPSARVRPTGVGAELFLWGHGIEAGAHALFDPANQLQALDVPETPGASLLTPPSQT